MPTPGNTTGNTSGNTPGNAHGTPPANAPDKTGASPASPIPERPAHRLEWLLHLTGLPTAAGREGRVIRWVEHWAAQRDALTLHHDKAGNLLILPAAKASASCGALVLFTAHLDHPAFVVEQLLGEGEDAGTVVLTFRGGVLDPYFENARILIHPNEGAPVAATLVETGKADPLRRCVAEADDGASLENVRIGDVATWDLPAPEIRDGELHAPACDDLAAVAAALCALEESVLADPGARVGVLLTRAEEVGFIGAIAACRAGTIPTGARVLALENSRAFAESPIGAGPIVRVGDRLSTFSPSLTAAAAQVCERLATQRAATGGFKWQRRLMPGGACEATCFCAYGRDATCLCLPLGNYHNMGNLDAVQAGEPSKAKIAPEHISVEDYHGLIDLLVACAQNLGDAEPLRAKMEKLYAERSFVLDG